MQYFKEMFKLKSWCFTARAPRAAAGDRVVPSSPQCWASTFAFNCLSRIAFSPFSVLVRELHNIRSFLQYLLSFRSSSVCHLMENRAPWEHRAFQNPNKEFRDLLHFGDAKLDSVGISPMGHNDCTALGDVAMVLWSAPPWDSPIKPRARRHPRFPTHSRVGDRAAVCSAAAAHFLQRSTFSPRSLFQSRVPMK